MIDLDHNAGVALDPRVEEAMRPAMRLGNASSTHARGRQARAMLDDARRRVAAQLGCEPGEVVFTASGSEANALALRGTYLLERRRSPRLVHSAIEHPSVREAAAGLRELDATVVEAPVDAQGVVQLEALEEILATGAALVAVMAANHETGALQPVAAVGALARARQTRLLVDAVQVAGKRPLGGILEVAPLVSLSAHKFAGPQGAGALLVRRGVPLWPLVAGHQERGRRGGTEWVAGAVGLATALELAAQGAAERERDTRAVRDAFEAGLAQRFPTARVHARAAERLPGTSSVCFPGRDGEALLMGLDLAGICASLGAACASGSIAPSPVLLAMGCTPAEARASVRFSWGPENTRAEVETTLDALATLLAR
jgi:cysteine desulfurase